jgi:hypothetical protein
MKILYDDPLSDTARRIAVIVAGGPEQITQALEKIATTYESDHTALMVKVYPDAEAVKIGGWSAQATWRAGRDPAWLIDNTNDIETRRKLYQRLNM